MQKPVQKQFHVEPLNPKQDALLTAIRLNPLVIAVGPAGTGKTFVSASMMASLFGTGKFDRIILTRANVPTGRSIGYFPGPQPLWAKVLTPSGWSTIGELQVDDYVIGSDGNPKRVLGVHEKGVRDVYKIIDKYGEETFSCLEHPWFTRTYEDRKRGRKGSIKSLAEIKDTLFTKHPVSKAFTPNHLLPSLSIVNYETKFVPMDGYLLGVLLGDGTITGRGQLIYTDNHSRLVKHVESVLPENMFLKKSGNNYVLTGNWPSNKKPYQLRELTGRWTNPTKNHLESLNLLGCACHNKFIPSDYLYNSVETRLSILQGLMDTDGTVKKSGEATFYTTSYNLALGVKELVNSLGGNTQIRSRDRRGKKIRFGNRVANTNLICYEVCVNTVLNPFRVNHKYLRYSKNVKPQSRSIKDVQFHSTEQTRCISIDSTDHLYVTDGFILTHNTLEEKMTPWLMPMISVLQERFTYPTYRYMLSKEQIVFQPIETIRGASFENSLILVDESQNLSYEELKSVVTRLGYNSKMILMGDPTQTDMKDEGLTRLVDISYKYKLDIPVITFGIEDIVRSDIVGKLVRAFALESV